ncbi:MAG TPA: hypothetical protein VFF64_17110 [Candidatus Eremiobacteraceae bacterium]|nr:hypothetical protein [Candidatus Eremiobacteraceae bacterium]
MEDQFETLESAHDFVALLAETAAEAKRELERDVQRESTGSRRVDALRLAAYKVDKLELLLNRSRRILNDLRTLRRLLFEERKIDKGNPVEATDLMPLSPPRLNSFAEENRSGQIPEGSAAA